MSPFVRPLVQVARRYNLYGYKLILAYIATVVTASLALSIYVEVRAAG